MLIVRSLQYQISASYCRMYQISVGIMGSQGSHCHIVLLLASNSTNFLLQPKIPHTKVSAITLLRYYAPTTFNEMLKVERMIRYTLLRVITSSILTGVQWHNRTLGW